MSRAIILTNIDGVLAIRPAGGRGTPELSDVRCRRLGALALHVGAKIRLTSTFTYGRDLAQAILIVHGVPAEAFDTDWLVDLPTNPDLEIPNFRERALADAVFARNIKRHLVIDSTVMPKALRAFTVRTHPSLGLTEEDVDAAIVMARDWPN